MFKNNRWKIIFAILILVLGALIIFINKYGLEYLQIIFERILALLHLI